MGKVNHEIATTVLHDPLDVMLELNNRERNAGDPLGVTTWAIDCEVAGKMLKTGQVKVVKIGDILTYRLTDAGEKELAALQRHRGE